MRTVFLVAVWAASVPLWAQIDNGNIIGRVTDSTGGAIAAVAVTVTQTETNFETVAVTNAEGLYRALNLRPGPYRIAVVAPGFKKAIRDGIELRVNSTLAVNMQLEIGAANESVEVGNEFHCFVSDPVRADLSQSGEHQFGLQLLPHGP